jgi:hypothetical protein
MTFVTRTRILALSTLALTAAARTAAADTVVQVDVSSVIDGRTVSTVANNVVTPWTPGQGIDNDGGPNGYVTNAVEAILQTQGKTVNHVANPALPNDGMFPADPGGRFPAIQLHFSDAAPITSPQTHSLHHTTGSQSFMFTVPQATYSKMFLIITSSEGTGNLTVTLNYAGSAAPTVSMLQLPDYGVGGAQNGDPVFFNLISGMHKWTTTDTENDVNTHTITGIELHPTPTAMLTSIEVAKTNDKYMVFWGATGIATSAVTTGAGGGAGSADGGATDASGAGGAGGAGGMIGGGGTSGAGGVTGAAGAATAGSGGGAPGTAGAGGAPGTAGSSSGEAGAGGAPGTAGASSSGTAGSAPRSSGGGCSLAGATSGREAALLLALVAGALPWRRRRRARR